MRFTAFVYNMSAEKRGLKLHSIIEKLSEQCERNSPSHDEEGDDNTCSLEIPGAKRKQRKRNEVKRVCKDALSQSESEDDLSDIEIEMLEDEIQESFVEKSTVNGPQELQETGGIRASARLREARQNMLQKQNNGLPSYRSEISTSKQNKQNMKVTVHISKVVDKAHCPGVDKDLAINVDAFVHHLPVLKDIESDRSSPCPFCFVFCEDKHDLVQHLKDYHQSDCATVGSKEDCESASEPESIRSESDEDFTPYKVTKLKKTKVKKSLKKRLAAGTSQHPDCGMQRGDVTNKTQSAIIDVSTSMTCSQPSWSCPSCNEKLSSEKELSSHVSFCTKSIGESRKRYKCGKCNQFCTTGTSLKKHQALHSNERPYKCDVCSACFKDKSYLTRHAVTHSGVKNFKCQVCGKLFSHKRTLREHQFQHTGERPYKCQHCDTSFTNSSSLKTHTARHTGIYPYKCKVCDRSFAKSYGLKMHELSHSNEKPFVCEVCGKGFKRADHLREHRIIHSNNKPFKCETCHKTFSQRVCLRKHLPCREHEKREKKAKNLQSKRTTSKKKDKASSTRTPNTQKIITLESNARGPAIDYQDSAKIADACGIPNDINVSSSENSPNSFLDPSQSPPSFVRVPTKLIETEYYSGQNSTHDGYSPDREFSSQNLTDRSRSSPMSSLLPSAFLPNLSHAMFSIVDPLSLDTLPDAHVLTGRPLNHERATDLGSLLSTMDAENLGSIVEHTDSFFTGS